MAEYKKEKKTYEFLIGGPLGGKTGGVGTLSRFGGETEGEGPLSGETVAVETGGENLNWLN